MNYIVLDMEWNIPKYPQQKISEPIPLHGEIIQIGAMKLNRELQEVDTFDRLIRPVFYPEIHRKVEELTQITDAQLKAGIAFERAIEQFKTWIGEQPILLTWGPDDIDMLYDNLEIHEMDTGWIPEHFDAQLMFDDLVTMEGRNYSLDYARFTFGIKGRDAHDALNDAYNTAEVLRHLEVASWIEEERQYRLEQKEEDFADKE